MCDVQELQQRVHIYLSHDRLNMSDAAMSSHDQNLTTVSSAPTVMDALEYEAPFVIEKLVKTRIVETADEGEALFAEAKKYLVLVRTDETKIWQMHSLRVDEAWHQFILFTKQYSDFCQRFFGRFIHHSPSNAPEETEGAATIPVASFVMFRDRYEELFGIPLPDLWYDERSVTPERRVLNERAGRLTLRDSGEMLELVTPTGDVLLSVNEVARDALGFACRTGAFYVRELPGGLTDHEKVALVATLVECRVLRLAG